jgi:hypothetical protein
MHDLKIDRCIPMTRAIAGGTYLAPRNFRMPLG